ALRSCDARPGRVPGPLPPRCAVRAGPAAVGCGPADRRAGPRRRPVGVLPGPLRRCGSRGRHPRRPRCAALHHQGRPARGDVLGAQRDRRRGRGVLRDDRHHGGVHPVPPQRRRDRAEQRPRRGLLAAAVHRAVRRTDADGRAHGPLGALRLRRHLRRGRPGPRSVPRQAVARVDPRRVHEGAAAAQRPPRAGGGLRSRPVPEPGRRGAAARLRPAPGLRHPAVPRAGRDLHAAVRRQRGIRLGCGDPADAVRVPGGARHRHRLHARAAAPLRAQLRRRAARPRHGPRRRADRPRRALPHDADAGDQAARPVPHGRPRRRGDRAVPVRTPGCRDRRRRTGGRPHLPRRRPPAPGRDRGRRARGRDRVPRVPGRRRPRSGRRRRGGRPAAPAARAVRRRQRPDRCRRPPGRAHGRRGHRHRRGRPGSGDDDRGVRQLEGRAHPGRPCGSGPGDPRRPLGGAPLGGAGTRGRGV
ncbi:MAG: Coenzyme F390 synthetase, partial [uncultured Pseudonocardia sp.]